MLLREYKDVMIVGIIAITVVTLFILGSPTEEDKQRAHELHMATVQADAAVAKEMLPMLNFLRGGN